MRCLERGEPLARRGVREDEMIDQTRSREDEVANLEPHYRAMLEDTGFVVVRRRAVEFRTEGA
jgi:hypothetical protein